MRNLHLVCILLLACAVAGAQQPPQGGGITPKTGAVFENVYANVFFGFNFRFPQDYEISFVAGEGPCAPECVLLEVRVSGYPKLPRSITISAEAGPGRADHLASAALVMEQSGARKLSGVREIVAGTHKLYRADYRSQLLNADLYQAFIAMPDKNYLVVFTFAAESRKQLDILADELSKSLTFVGATPASHSSTTH